MKNTSYTSEGIREMVQTAVGKMIPVIHLFILVWVFNHVGGFTTAGYLGDIYEKLELAENIINSTKEELPTNCHPQLPMDCEDWLNKGEKKSGIYLVRPKNRVIAGSIPIYCDMDTDGGGWTVIQRRGNFSRSKDYFYEDWQAYKEGFGKLEEDFWLGNDYIYALSNQKLYSVRFDLEDAEGEKRFATYDRFWIEEESNNYALHVTGYNGDAGDSFTYHNGCKFSTKDRDNDISEDNCAEYSKGAWWYKNCQRSGLNGEFLVGQTEKKGEGLVWYDWKGKSESLAATEVKLRSSHVTCEKAIPPET